MKATIEVPDGLDATTAQQCFRLGLKAYSACNNSGLCVIHGVERDGESVISVITFRGEYATAVMKFCQGVRYLSNQDPVTKNLVAMRDQGSTLLRELQSTRNANPCKNTK